MTVETENGRPPELSPAKRALLEKRLRGDENGTGETTPRIPRRVSSEPVAVSFAQRRLWFAQQLAPNSPLYHISTALRIQGPLDRDALERSLRSIVARHESLRTHFISQDGELLQVVDTSSVAILPTVELTGQSNGKLHLELRRLLKDEICRPFDLSTDILLRALLVKLAPTEHALLITVHHIASDGWSMGILIRELMAFYGAFVSGSPVSLAELPIQYPDFAIWQRARMQGQRLQGEIQWWKQHLAEAPHVLELPTDRPRPAVQSFRGHCRWKTFPQALSTDLKTLSLREGATLYTTLLAAFQVLLHRITGQPDLLVGSPVACRGQTETEGLIGLFVNMIVLRSGLSDNPTFREFLRRTRKEVLEAFAHQELPFETLVEELKPERKSSCSPLIQAVFALQNAPEPFDAPTGLTVTSIPEREIDTGTAKFDLTVQVEDGENGLTAIVEYNADLFDPATIDRLLEHFQVLLEGVVENPNQEVKRLPLLTPAERHQLLVEWNGTRTSYPRDKSIPELFAAQVARNPQAMAVTFEQQHLSYRQLDQRANQIANLLRELGIERDVPVAVCVERSIDWIVALLGILKAGGAYVSLEPADPQERLAFVLQDTRAPVLLTQEKLRGVFKTTDLPANLKVICLDGDGPAIAHQNTTSASMHAAAPGPSDLAYVCYTSGSTGKPKGVGVPHRAIIRLLFNTDYVHLNSADAVAQISNGAFDASTFEIWGALLHGGRLAIIPQRIVLSASALAHEIRAQRITTMFVTTALFNQLSRERPDIFRPVHHLLFGGEAVNPLCVHNVLSHGPPSRLLHVYGPTEATTFTTWHQIHALADVPPTLPIGRPIANTETYVLDELQQPVPIGVTGELYVGGDGLARGYLNLPGLTAEKFIPHPFRNEPEARLYRTGDLVRYWPDGNLEFVGRTDRQVKLRGFRVELEEIETALHQHPGVRECVVVACDVAGDARLNAYLVGRECNPPLPDELRLFLRTKLPDYMVPSAFVFLPSLPLTVNGKVNREALPASDRVIRRPESVRNPRDEIESRLTEIWEELLGLRPIGIRDNFFDLGGHSLLAMRLLARVERALGRTVPVSALFQSPTLGEFAETVRAGQKETALAGSSIVAIQPNGSKPPLFLVHGAGGGMFWGYTNLSRHLGPDQPVYAFKARELSGPEALSPVEEMAACYVAELREFQPRGPYHLGGYCFGGNVAWEMARQLQAGGEHVALLALMNSAPTHSRNVRVLPTPAWMVRFFTNLCYLTACFLRRPFQQQRRFIAWQARTLAEKLTRMFGRAAAPKGIDANDLVDLSMCPPEQRPLWEAHIRALLAHRTQPYSGRATLLRSRAHSFWCSFDPTYDWGGFVEGGIDVRIVPGAHEQILEEPHVQVVAQELAGALKPATQNEGHGFVSLVQGRHAEEGGATDEYPRQKCIHDLFEEQVQRTPEAVAVCFGGENLTYRHLNERANQLALHLTQRGIEPDTPIAVCLERSLSMAVSVLAILKAGGAYVPLDPAYPRERLRLMLRNARVPLVVTQRSLVTHLETGTTDWQVLCVEDFSSVPPVAHQRQVPQHRATPDHLAYVIHTSGSTGTPKGVAMPHRPLVNLIAWQLRNSSAGAKARTLQFASLSFDVSFQEMFSTWCAGGTLVLVDEEIRRDPVALLRYIMEQRIDRLFLPFVALQQLAEASCEQKLIPSSLHEIITAGEQLQITPSLVRMFEQLPDCTLHNHYGPSETHVVTAFCLTGPPNHWPALPPIGQPIANTQVHLLDEARQPVSAGTEGEIYIGGDCLARGYLHRPELTAERFVSTPFQADGSPARLYKTGDLGRRRADGNIEFLGRIDHQVKIRGFRIELGEIEAVLRHHPKVREAVVVAREDQAGDKRLVAYFVSKTAETATVEELRRFLKDRLPEYMGPSAFVPLEALPLTPNGKVDRKQLPAPTQIRLESLETFVAPRDDLERQLVGIWEKILNVRPIGIHDQFFESGGHSLLAARVVAELEKLFGRKVSVSALFQSATVERLATLLRDGANKTQSPASSIVSIQPKGSQRPLFLVHGAGGGMFWGYANLSRQLGTNQPIYAFNSRGLDGLEEFRTIEQMAAQYVADLRAFQPRGPYCLGGYCFGGNVAYEMARQLEAIGEKVTLLALFNSWPPNSSYTRPRFTPAFGLRFLRNLRYWTNYVLGLNPGQRRELLLWKARSIVRKSLHWANRLRTTTPDIDLADWVDLSAQPEDRHELWSTHIRAYLEHEPQPFGGHLTLFRTRCHPLVCSFDETCAWRELARGGVTVHVVPGAHESVLDEPHVRVLARELERDLQAASITQRAEPKASGPLEETKMRQDTAAIFRELDGSTVRLASPSHNQS